MTDFTCVCILDGFKNETAAKAMERLLKKVSEQKAKELVKVCVRGGSVHWCIHSLTDAWYVVDQETEIAITHFRIGIPRLVPPRYVLPCHWHMASGAY
jgi:hypothetical protein